MKERFVEVAVGLPIRKTFTYLLPEELPLKDYTGYRVLVPFKNQETVGYILGDTEKIENVKEILEILDSGPIFTKKMVSFFRWLSDYYFYPIGQIIQTALPPGINVIRYRVARITKKGEKALDELPENSPEKKALLWIKENPYRRIEDIPQRILDKLSEKGWIKVKRKIKKKEGKDPLIRKFAKIKEGVINVEGLSDEEKEFLNEIKKNIPLCRLIGKFRNVYYLARKLEKKGIIKTEYLPIHKAVDGQIIGPVSIPERLHPQQEKALSEIYSSLKEGKFSVKLLFGVTGSGKTEVYRRAAKMAISMGKKVIFLLPEISLVLYMESIFRQTFGERVAVYHSRMSPGERYDQWMRMIKGEVDIVIGARSAIFSPLPNVGLIIVDEEHDPSYKQETAPYYHARDCAVMRGKIEDALVILGSGTPSVQSYYNSQIGKYTLIEMPKRVEDRPLPEMEIVDMRKERAGTILSKRLLSSIKEELEKGNQVILFLNKRGFYRLCVCSVCGTSIKCPNCDLSLVYHKDGKLRCHYCGYYSERPERCKICGYMSFRLMGFGTERVEREIKRLFPEAKVERMDADSVRKKGKIADILKRFSEKKIDILIGTQMITKGYHFPSVTLVGIISADISLSFPDFRAAEWTYQLLCQVAGRAGRGEQKGKVIVQTFNPDHYCIKAAIRHSFFSFYEKEKTFRECLRYPPFSHLSCIRIQGNSEKNVCESAKMMEEEIKKILENYPFKDQIQILGPIESPIKKLKGKYRWQIIIKSSRHYIQKPIFEQIEKMSERLKTKGVSISIDVDPYYML